MKYLKYVTIVFVVCSYFLLLQPKIKSTYAAVAGFNSDCLEIKDGRAVGSDDVWGHTAELLFPTTEQRSKRGSQAALPGKKTWVFVCIATTTGNKCTSGNPDIDMEVFGKRSDYDDLAGSADYQTKEIGGVVDGKNPTSTTNDAEPQFTNPPIYWYDIYVPGVSHQWLWLQEAEPPKDDGMGAGDLGAQQQATFDFVRGLADSSKCAKISWDPKGYVFDASTLYPVKGVSITISQKGTNGVFTDIASQIGLSNPDISQEKSGQYSFFTPPGTYKLRITSSNATIADINTVNLSYKKVFTLLNPISTIYQTNNEIVETAGTVVVSHIPVSVTNESMLIKDLSVMMRKEEKSLNQEILFSGVLSHPNSVIKIDTSYIDKDGKTSQDTKTEMTDEVGEYAFSLPQTKSTEKTTIYLTKYTVTFSLNPAIYPNPGRTSPQNTFSGDVIPSYIEGIAYDKVGKPIANAIVGIYPSYSEKAMYYTSTDENGKYTIDSQHIPQFHYELSYKKKTGEVITLTPSSFIKQNTSYFAANNISPFKKKVTLFAEEKKAQDRLNTITGNKVPDIKKSEGGSISNPRGRYEIIPSVTPTGVATSINGDRTKGIAIVIVIVTILIMTAVGAFVVIKAKKPQVEI